MSRKPLSEAELQGLEHLERRMVRFYLAAMAALAIAALLVVNYGEIAWLRRTLLACVLALVAAAAIVQLRSRCPRCNGRIALTARLRLPARCRACAIPFARPPGGGDGSS